MELTFRKNEGDKGEVTNLRSSHRWIALDLTPPAMRCRSRATWQRDELAPHHSITSSAVNRNLDGTSIPRALADLRLLDQEATGSFCVHLDEPRVFYGFIDESIGLNNLAPSVRLVKRNCIN